MGVWVRDPCCIRKDEGHVDVIGSMIRLVTAVCNIGQRIHDNKRLKTGSSEVTNDISASSSGEGRREQ